MTRFFSFCSKFAGAILSIIGTLAAILWALESGLAITKAGAWGHPDKAVGDTISFSIAVSGFAFIIVFGFLSIFSRKLKVLAKIGKIIILTIAILIVLGLIISSAQYLSSNSGWTEFPDNTAKASIGIFSVGIILLVMNVLFGIFAFIGKKTEEREQRKQAAV